MSSKSSPAPAAEPAGADRAGATDIVAESESAEPLPGAPQPTRAGGDERAITRASSSAAGSGRSSWLRAVGYFGLAALCVYLFYDARGLNSGFHLPREGTSSVPEAEQVFYVWYALYGSLATLFVALGLTELRVAAWLRQVLEVALARPAEWTLAIALMAFAACLGFRQLVLLDQPVTDDEGTYSFIARTLLEGRVSNPPPGDNLFFKNQFVVVTSTSWHGKYPIGHPIVLAIGGALGAMHLMMPLVTALCVLLTYRVGRRVFDERVAVAGATLLLVSPHFVWTGATLLSQPTMALCMLLGMLALLRYGEDLRPRWLLAAGGALGFGVLVRPMPGAPFALAGAAFLLHETLRRDRSAAGLISRLALFGLGALPFLLAFLAVNYAQSGSPLTSGYHEYHGNVPVLYNDKGQITNSLGGAIIRENFWLLGWTFALLLVPFAKPARAPRLFWGVIAGEVLYRLVAPKTVVAVTGPIYTTEIVPLLVLALADGLARIGRFFHTFALRPAVVAVAATVVGFVMFVPLPAGALIEGAAARRTVFEALEQAEADRALVFANFLVDPKQRVTWAYFPDNPSPRLDDRWLFVRVPPGDQVRARLIDFWQRRFPDRRAFLYVPAEQGGGFQELTR